MTAPRPAMVYRILAVTAVAILILANAHLIYVSTATQPPCVAHVKAGDKKAPAGSFSAAGPAC